MKLEFESSTACNARCTFCPRYDMTRPMGEMSDELFHKIIKEGKEMGIRYYLPFLNGEPFVFPRIWQWLDYMEKEGVKVSLYTNAEFVDVDRLVKYKNIRYVNCSLNATTAETHKKVMRGPDFKRCVKNTQDLIKKAPFKVKVSFVVTEDNAHELEEFNKIWKTNRAKQDFLNWTNDRHSPLERKGDKVPCYYVFNSINILWDGRVVACCMDYDGKMILGDLNKQSLKEIWDNAKWLRLQHSNLEFTGICKNCNSNVK